MARDYLQEAKEAYEDARDACREQYNRIKEDFRFSNPSEPEQWDNWAKTARAGRPMHTLDRTNQFIQHSVNTELARKTSADVMAVDSKGDPAVAHRIKGLIKHIEYTSRADISWGTAADHQRRGGLGWVRIVPKIVDEESNEQEILLQRVIDPTSCMLDENSTEPDGSDAMHGFIETMMTKRAFERTYPKAKMTSWDADSSEWFSEDGVRICEYFKVIETKSNRIVVGMPDGQQLTLSEDEYWKTAQQIGFQPEVLNTFTAKDRKVKWCKLTGAEILEETEFPSRWIPLIPVQGHELWIEGKKYLCGMVRRLMDGQRLHNYEMSALTEALMVQPKAPFMMSVRAMDGLDDQFQKLNTGNPTAVLYNDLDDQGQPINAPIRLSPPNFPVAYANSANMAVLEMEAAVGMPKPVLGQQSNAISGRAKMADKEAGETATFHFVENGRISKEHAYRVLLDMIPRVYSGRRQARILGDDDQQSSVMLDDEGPAVQRQGGKIVSINLSAGRYDVRVKVGPSYSTIREEIGTKLQELGKGNPVLAAALTPIILKMSDMPEADKVARIAMAMLPPEIQKAYMEDDGDLPPQAKMQIDSQGQQIQQMAQAMEQAAKVIQDLQDQVNDKNTEVESEAQKAMSEIKLAQNELKMQAQQLKAQEQGLADAQRIAMLEIQLAQQGESNEEAASKEGSQTSQGQQALQVTVPSNDEAVMALAQVVKQAQETMAQVVSQNSQLLTQTQALIVDAIEDMADAMAAPRKIALQKDANGRTTGATSVVLMENENAVSDE